MQQPQTNSTDTANNDYALDQIDQAINATKQAAHACTNPQAKEHLEYALALITECWIAESDQQARNADTVIANVKQALNLFAALEAHTNNTRKEGN